MLFNTENIHQVAFNDMNIVHHEELEMVNQIYDYLCSTKDHDHQ